MNDNHTNLDTKAMNQLLKGDTFPEGDTDIFLGSNIKSFFDELLAKSSLKKSDVIREANIARTYGYQILEGSRIANRDYYLRIAIAMKLDLREAQRLLAITQTGALHALVKRDAAIIFAINHNYDNIETYEFMTKLGLPTLEKDEI